MKPEQYRNMLETMIDAAAKDRDQDGDFDGRWQDFVDALAEAYERALDLC